jgi:hypothetical protein
VTATFVHRPLFGWRCRLWVRNKLVGEAWGEEQYQALNMAMTNLVARGNDTVRVHSESDSLSEIAVEEISTWGPF